MHCQAEIFVNRVNFRELYAIIVHNNANKEEIEYGSLFHYSFASEKWNREPPPVLFRHCAKNPFKRALHYTRSTLPSDGQK